MKEQKKKLEALVEGPGGDLLFKPVKASGKELKQIAKESKNPVLKKKKHRLAMLFF